MLKFWKKSNNDYIGRMIVLNRVITILFLIFKCNNPLISLGDGTFHFVYPYFDEWKICKEYSRVINIIIYFKNEKL